MLLSTMTTLANLHLDSGKSAAETRHVTRTGSFRAMNREAADCVSAGQLLLSRAGQLI
jgi:hypothetical protein